MDELRNQIKQLEHLELYSFYRFFSKHLVSVFRLGNPQKVSSNVLEQKVLEIDPKGEYQKLYELEKWFKSYVKGKRFT